MDDGRISTVLNEPDRESGGIGSPEKRGPGTALAAKFRPLVPSRKGEIGASSRLMLNAHQTSGH